MTDIREDERSHLEAKLRQELSELEVELNAVGRKNPANPADWEAEPPEGDIQPGDYNEQADKAEGYEENTAVLKELEIRWNNVKRALAKLNDGTYGTCEVGGEPIELARLKADPAARTCIAHKDTPLP